MTLREVDLSEINTNIYINEFLSKDTNFLFSLTRKARTLQPQFFLSTFTRDGRVAIKIKDVDKYIFLENENDLFKLCDIDMQNKLWPMQSEKIEPNNTSTITMDQYNEGKQSTSIVQTVTDDHSSIQHHD